MKSRPGFAIAVALFAVVLIASIAAAVSYTTNEETRVTRAAALDEEAHAFAEEIAAGALSSWPCESCDQTPIGSVFIREAQSAPPLEGTLYITRLDSALYLVTGEGRAATPAGVLARRRISIAVTARRDSLGAFKVSRTRGQYWADIYQM